MKDSKQFIQALSLNELNKEFERVFKRSPANLLPDGDGKEIVRIAMSGGFYAAINYAVPLFTEYLESKLKELEAISGVGKDAR